MRSPVLTLKRARRLRREMTLPETMLWQRLRRRGEDPPLRRQHPVGVYILDFYCSAARLAVEIDGAGHDTADQARHDARRDAWLASQGIEIMRIAAGDFLRDPDEVALGVWTLAAERMGGIRAVSERRSPPPPASPVPLPRCTGEEN
ncbi:endonuclease domain-containing protein [Caulobacter endophyticus]|uniref:Endonuclease domain-containing protein n=1 Tax=Caulobacter endophyticus TaxID=2172652 RepID=A0A2T9K3E5_9CAUL|nr:endonuclease domain-containing protein [Caulobacter endophyticus]PVM90331.1 endonuclease domain-containing protein [Caulobacter endophyticus]